MNKHPLSTGSNGANTLVIGSSGAIGAALIARLQADERIASVIGLSRRDGFDLLDEESISKAAQDIASRQQRPRLVIVATGMLHDGNRMPEKGWRELDPAFLARSFAINAIGPALIMKHFLPLLPRDGRSVLALLSARVGSIGDNRLGGWYSYRASKAALNQFVRSMSIELARRNPEAILVAVHPGTVDSRLSAPFAKKGLDPITPEAAAEDMLAMLERLAPADSGKFLDRHGKPIPW